MILVFEIAGGIVLGVAIIAVIATFPEALIAAWGLAVLAGAVWALWTFVGLWAVCAAAIVCIVLRIQAEIADSEIRKIADKPPIRSQNNGKIVR